MFKFISRGIVVLALLSAPAVHAADDVTPEHLAAAQDTAVAVGAIRQMELVLPLMMGQMERNFSQFNPELTDDFAAVFDKLRDVFDKRLRDFANRAAKAYAAEFSAEELKTITAFYNSRAGRKFEKNKRQLEKSNARIGREFSEKLGREIDTAVRAEMKKRGHDF